MKKASDTKLGISNSVLILGEPGTGKTLLSTQFPNCFVLNVDNNIEGPIRWLRCNGGKTDFYYGNVMFAESKEELAKIGLKADVPDPNHLGVIPVPREWRFRWGAYQLLQACASPDIDTVVIDSLTTYNDVVKDEVRRQHGLGMGDPFAFKGRTVDPRPKRDDSFALWDGYGFLLKNTIFELKKTGKRIVCTGHVMNKDGGSDLYIAVAGQLQGQLAGHFEEVWLIENRRVPGVGGKFENKRFITTQPGPGQTPLGLKSATQLPIQSELDFDTLFKQLATV